ncbi:zinc finger MYM-type protein 1-like [Pyrus x bretschneideri]|uniref:zinc finger MYM-type protein 1-like n=1 Tax=Pyrus x bretschneideri TaxID=225117 RepID=UPI00202E1F13|nr:zinc finger MYM-type protein 1-like [Pyrus x bretschneideri]
MFDIGDDAFFSVLVDESRDISVKEQMAVVLRYVNTNGQVVERFVGIKHVPNTTAFSLKEAIDQLFSINGLSISRLHGQGYDGASNMQEYHVNVKTWLEKDNKPKLWKLFKIISFQVGKA